ncbi:MAG: YihY/virulence factor BrkB family protein [Actinomycetota bacterium]|nr:YihY/virulence factor BrkB family protein [Actinomycetota bacterium]
MTAASEGAEPGRPGLVDRVKTWFAELRLRRPLVDHTARMVEHMGAVQGTILAGAVTYFGYLSFFPVLVIAFTVVAVIANVVPEVEDVLIATVESVFPDLIGTKRDSPIQISTFTERAGTVGFVALLGLLYSGLGWISAARAGLEGVFQVPPKQRRNILVGKLIDVMVLAVVGTVLILSVGLSSVVTNVTEDFLVLLQVDEIPGPGFFWLLRGIGVALGVAASTGLFFSMFTLLPTIDLPRSAVVKGAFVAALGFEVLKLLAGVLIGLATDNPATAVLGVSLVLLVWINYFSRVIMVGAAWAYTSPEARLVRDRQAERQRTREQLAARRRMRRERYGYKRRMGMEAVPGEPAAQRRVDRLSVAAGLVGGATASALVRAVRRRH